jgi:GNAT superfamily N-acetyltransferase
MTIAFESPDQPEVIALIAELDAYQDTLYPPESRHYLDLASLKSSNVFFAVARDSAGRAIGCGAVVLYPAFGEIKRMYVSPRGRGQGVARNYRIADIQGWPEGVARVSSPVTFIRGRAGGQRLMCPQRDLLP